MLNNTPVTVIVVLAPASLANTAAATSGWVDVSNYEGTILFVSNIGAVTAGNIVGKIQHASDGAGTGSADVVGATFATASAPGTEVIRVNSNALGPFVRYVGTITTGPVIGGVVLLGSPKY
jgi:hypothetical protein